MEKFNENLEQFIKNLSKISKDNDFSKHYNFDNPGDSYLKMFYANTKDLGNDIANKDEIIFSEENTILNHINFNKIWNLESLSDENRDIIWNYLHTLYIFAYEHIKEVDIKNVLKQLKNISPDSNELDDDTKTLINIINTLTNKFSENTIEEINDETEENMSFDLPQLFNGTIGNLAKEIASEIDTNAINLEDPISLLKDLMSGNFDENNDESGIVNLVKNITNKIQTKITTGDLQESDLLSDASNLMKNFASSDNQMGGMGGMGGMEGMGDMGELGNIFNNLMSNMGNMSSMQKGMMKTNLERTQTSNETKERLKKKLEEKKKLLAEQEKILEDELNNLDTHDLRDIDDLVNEIEGGNVPKKKKKKKKKKNLKR